MFITRQRLLLRLIFISCFGTVVQHSSALTVDLIPEVVAALDPSNYGFIEPVPDIDSFPGHPAIYQVDFSIFVYDLLPVEAGFANIGFNVLMENLTDAAGGVAA